MRPPAVWASNDVPHPPTTSRSGTTSTPVVLSDEVLLRSKIAQLQLEKAKQQQQQQRRKGKSKSKRGQQQPAAAAGASSSSSSSPPPPPSSASAARGKGGRPGGKAPFGAVSKHQLASSDDAGEEAATSTPTTNGNGSGRAQSRQPESEEDVMRRFEAQVTILFYLA